MASTFHAIHTIASKLSPASEKSSGILEIESETIKIKCYQAITGNNK